MEDELASALAAIEARLARLEASPPDDEQPPPPQQQGDPLWVLSGLAARVPGDAVVLAGRATTSEGPVQWQYGRSGAALDEATWSDGADALAALAHPVRLAMMQAAHRGGETVPDLAREAAAGSTGQAYHHLGQLTAAGWLTQRSRGRYGIPPERVVPLLVLLLIAGVA